MAQSRVRYFAGWILRVLLIAFFAYSAFNKLRGAPSSVETFAKIGMGQWLRYVSAIVELGAAALVAWPRATWMGALMMLGVCFGAFVARLGTLGGGLIHVIVLALVVCLMAFLTRRGAVPPSPRLQR